MAVLAWRAVRSKPARDRWFFLTAHLACDAARNKAVLQRRAQQQVIDAQPGIAGEGITEILPKDLLAQSVGPDASHSDRC
jgi:hypothetical protein